MADVEQTDNTRVFFNPQCSKCRTARGLLEERGIEAEYVRYLDQPPSRADLEELMGLLGIDDPREMMRTGEAIYKELDLASADRDQLLDAVTAHPILLERPILVRNGRAVIARPAERALELLD
jgi:arsenate reductase